MVKILSPREIISRIKICSWRYNDKKNLGEHVHYGMLAQDLLEEFGREYNFVDESNDYLKINYMEFIGPIIKYIQEQDLRITQLEQQVKHLTNIIKNKET